MCIRKILMLAIVSINLTACSSMSGNVVPQSGPNMEQVYDGMDKKVTAITKEKNDQNDLPTLRQTLKNTDTRAFLVDADIQPVQKIFHKLPNPELVLFIYPHLAGHDQVPIPGYFTEFSAYEKDYYALPQENLGN